MTPLLGAASPVNRLSPLHQVDAIHGVSADRFDPDHGLPKHRLVVAKGVVSLSSG
jgi:hypothetical protein